jgi:hypothetical protein
MVEQDYFATGSAELFAQNSDKYIKELYLRNARENLKNIEHSITESVTKHYKKAVVIAAGPSLHRKNIAKRILENKKEDTCIVSCDGSLGYCLRNDLVPDYVVTLDPHAGRIVRWFGDPDIETKLANDDYFKRQDMDPIHHKSKNSNDSVA